jgi:transcriptional regulator with XRE-family HTH domain
MTEKGTANELETAGKLNIGFSIKRIREFKNLTQEAVAEKVGMSVTAYGDIERGKADVNFARLATIAKTLEVKEEDIVTFGYSVYVNNITNNDYAVSMLVNNGTILQSDKTLTEKMIKDKDEEIAFLREQLRKAN